MKTSLTIPMQLLRTLILVALMGGALLLSAPAVLASPVQQFDGTISSPRANAVVQGVVSIQGIATHPEFQKYEVRLAPGLNPNLPDDQWIRLLISETPVVNGQLAVWDTGAVADGAYILRLRVVRLDSNYQDIDISPINVANAVPPTVAPTATSAIPTATPTPEITSTPLVAGATVTALGTQVEGGTPGAVATLAPSGTLPASGSPSPTPIIIDQPTIIVATGTPDPNAVAVNPVATQDNDSSDDNSGGNDSLIPGLPDGIPNVESGTFTEPLIYGAAATAGVFVVVGVLYIVRALFRAARR